jgi:hypothetical protein
LRSLATAASSETFDERMLFEAMRDVMQWLPQE